VPHPGAARQPGSPLTPVPAAAATRIRANPWRPFVPGPLPGTAVAVRCWPGLVYDRFSYAGVFAGGGLAGYCMAGLTRAWTGADFGWLAVPGDARVLPEHRGRGWIDVTLEKLAEVVPRSVAPGLFIIKEGGSHHRQGRPCDRADGPPPGGAAAGARRGVPVADDHQPRGQGRRPPRPAGIAQRREQRPPQPATARSERE
jgi:hypothetical protein